MRRPSSQDRAAGSVGDHLFRRKNSMLVRASNLIARHGGGVRQLAFQIVEEAADAIYEAP